MELMEGGDLECKPLMPEAKVSHIFKKLLLAVRHCHEQDIIHRDIKPANIMFTSCGEVKMIDFGLAL